MSITHHRPDIVHQCLLALLDSPLGKAGRLQVFIHTQRDILIEVNPQVRIPRTYKRFAGLMVQLLQKLSVRAASSSQTKLLKVIKVNQSNRCFNNSNNNKTICLSYRILCRDTYRQVPSGY
jgi:rRNA pseudouridine-1189 N-methylase Emg1 (Nep1/Mra1 family)